MKSVDVSTMNAKKETASIIHAERAFASAQIEGMLKRNKAAVEQERNENKATIALKDSLLAKKDGEIKKSQGNSDTTSNVPKNFYQEA
jgi:hypothetical protein